MKDKIKLISKEINNNNTNSNSNIVDSNNNNIIIKKDNEVYTIDYQYKEPIKDYSKYLSLRNSTPCQLTEVEIQTFLISSDLYSFGAGVPNKLFFPIKELEFKFNFIENEKVELTGEELNTIQQYSSSQGLPRLLDWCRGLQMRYQGLPDPKTKGNEWDIVMTPGSQHGLDCVFKALFNRGDTMLVERYTYGGMFALSHPAGINCVAVLMDDRGIIPYELFNLLSNWYINDETKNKKFPKVLYAIPHGQNPTGVIYDKERKEEIYKICCKFDLLIIEDDPHFFLQLDNPIGEDGNRVLVQSFLKIDKEKRVIRLDTFSKFLSSGIRMGFITTNSVLFGSIFFELNASIFHASGLTQITLEKCLLKWGKDGFDKHVHRVQDILRKKREETIELLEKHLKGQVEYRVPNSGLYFWVKLLGIECSYTFVRDCLQHQNVLFGLGISSSPDRSIKTPYIRITFSYLDKEDGEIVFKILSDSLKEYINNSKNTHETNDRFIYNTIS